MDPRLPKLTPALRATNMIERQNREFRKRTRKVSIFPNAGSALRLFGAMILELSEQWQGEAKRYLNRERRCSKSVSFQGG